MGTAYEIYQEKMSKTLSVLKEDLNTVRAGRANPVYLEPANHAVYEINYEMDALNGFQAYNDALTFVLGYCKEYDAAGNTLDPDAEVGKIALVKSAAGQMETELSEALGCHVKVFIIVGLHYVENN